MAAMRCNITSRTPPPLAFRSELAAQPSKTMAWRRPEIAKQLRPWNFKWMPSENVILVNNPLRETTRDNYTFRVPPHMNKFQIKDYLESIYDLRVKSVHTVNYDGKMKQRGGKPFKQKAYKKAVVFLHTDEEPVLPSSSNNSGSNVPPSTSTPSSA